MSDSLIRVAPFYYIHILDNNENTHRSEVGPMTFTKKDHEKIVLQPTPMVVIPPRHYCVISDPYIRKDEATKEPLVDDYGQVKLRHGDTEIRFSDEWQAPFPLLPGERMVGGVRKLEVVAQDSAFRLIARRDFTDSNGVSRVAGDEWLFKGPATYVPRVEVDNVERVSALVVHQDTALKIQARKHFVQDGVARKAGEEWLVREVGAYLPGVDERVVTAVQPNYLTQTRALHLRAADNCVDVYGKARKAGEEWLVTDRMAVVHLQDVHEEVVGSVTITVLSELQYCIVLDPVGQDGHNVYGARELRKGPAAFFLLPGESLATGIRPVYVLGDGEALLLKANEAFTDGDINRTPGDLWMIQGPTSYVPPVEVEVSEKRKRIPLDENEGIYVRDIKTGRVSSVCGRSYLLEAHEELWEKELSQEVEDLLTWSFFKDDANKKARDKTRVVSYRVPHNSAVQLYNYKTQKSRVVFGPGLVLLEPEEQFSVVSLSGDTPKRPNVIKTLALMLGPDFMTDVIEVESADHARLRLQLSYNWQFEVDKTKPEQAAQIFQVRDFVGDACKAIASRVRGAVATKTFDQFHKDSAVIIRHAVFGSGADVTNRFVFNANRLCITNIDIQSVEPVDQRTRESLMKSVQLAIEITTKKQERNARHQAEGIQQEARGRIERQKIINLKGAEEETQKLVELQAATKAVESAGTAKAEAKARAKQLEIEGEAKVAQATLAADASGIEARAQLQEMRDTQMAEVEHDKALADLELERASELAQIETDKFKALVDAIKPETIKAIARAGPEMQARLLKGLGLKGYLMTDGNSPINLFNAAKGMVTPQQMMAGAQQ